MPGRKAVERRGNSLRAKGDTSICPRVLPFSLVSSLKVVNGNWIS
jgi:hypothetical protein